MTIGNGVINGLDTGLQKNIVNNFSGDLVLVSDKQIEKTVLASMTGHTLKPITNFTELKPQILNIPSIDKILPAGAGYVWVLNENGNPLDQYLLGVDIESYLEFFNNNLIVEKGSLLKKNQRGVLVSTRMRDWYFDFTDSWTVPINTSFDQEKAPEKVKKNGSSLQTKKSIVYMGLSSKNASLDILTDVIGIVKFKELNSILGFYCIVDMSSFRECMGYFESSDEAVHLSTKNQNLMTSSLDSIDTLFNDSFDTVNESTTKIKNDLSDIKHIKTSQLDKKLGTYNIIFVKLKKDVNLNKTITQINNLLKEKNIPLQAISWNDAIGMFGQIAMLMKGSLFLFVLFIFIVAIIIIMNTLSMATMERIPEIGMMRAIGTKKRFIQTMFLAETSLLSFVFGGAGIILGSITIIGFKLLKLSTSHEMLQILYGGDTFSPTLDFISVGLCVLQLSLIVCLSSIYPIYLARKITPLDSVLRN
ncbi:FtsX-like permease family protein [bacterium]|nr:FtsX-like permease family protein [bacterium]